jgi:hypothetical protein
VRSAARPKIAAKVTLKHDGQIEIRVSFQEPVRKLGTLRGGLLRGKSIPEVE